MAAGEDFPEGVDPAVAVEDLEASEGEALEAEEPVADGEKRLRAQGSDSI